MPIPLIKAMDPIIVIPGSNSSSSTANNSMEDPNITANGGIYTNCTFLNELDLTDVFTRMDIGNTEFWGGVSGVWKAFFITYYVLFYAVLLVLFGSCVYLLRCALKQAFLLRTLVYLLTTYICWSTFSAVCGILIINSIANGSDEVSANVTRTLETITSSSFVSIVIISFFSQPDSRLQFSLRYAFMCTVFIYAKAIVLILLNLSEPVESLAAFILLIIFRSLIFIASILIVTVGVLYRHSFKNHRSLLVIAFSYFLLLYAYFLYTLTTVVNNNSCIEDIELHRVAWLVLNSLLRICEVSFSIVYFIKAAIFVKQMLTDNRSKKASSFIYTTQETIENSAYTAFQSGALAKRQVTPEFEIEELPSTPNLDKRYSNARGAESMPQLMSSSSTLTSRLHDATHDAAYTSDGTETLSDILDGKTTYTYYTY